MRGHRGRLSWVDERGGGKGLRRGGGLLRARSTAQRRRRGGEGRTDGRGEAKNACMVTADAGKTRTRTTRGRDTPQSVKDKIERTAGTGKTRNVPKRQHSIALPPSPPLPPPFQYPLPLRGHTGRDFYGSGIEEGKLRGRRVPDKLCRKSDKDGTAVNWRKFEWRSKALLRHGEEYFKVASHTAASTGGAK